MTTAEILRAIDAEIAVAMRAREEQSEGSPAEWCAIGRLDGLAAARAIAARREPSNVTRCRACGAAVLFLRTPRGASMPVNASTCAANETVYDPSKGHVSHYATCPDAAQFRRAKGKRISDDGK